MPDDKVTLPEVKPAEVTKPVAFRLLLGKLLVDFVESFVPMLAGIALFLPANVDDLRKIALLVAVPAAAAAAAAWRHVGMWGVIRKWLTGEEEPKK